MQILKIIPQTKIPLNQTQALTYFTSQEICPGALVRVAIRNRKVLGLVVEVSDLQEEKIFVKRASFKLKRIEEIVAKGEAVDQRLRELILWTGLYYWEPFGLVLKSALPRASLKKWRTLDTSLINPVKKSFSFSSQKAPQKHFVSKISFQKLLSLCQAQVKFNYQVLVLFPEIAKLTEAFKNIPQDLKDKTALFHSGLTAKIFWENWQRVRNGSAKIILATRQGVFLPFQKLGLIIVNEEESLSYKSWDQHPKINARHIALKLAELHQSKIIFTSLTPSVEMYYYLKKKRYHLMPPNKAIFSPLASKFCIISMQQLIEQPDNNVSFSYFSPELKEKIQKAVLKKDKILLFQNRRGDSTYIFCQDCGYYYQCPHCHCSLVYHRDKQKLLCHWCGHEENLPQECRQCHGHRLKYAGHGTQKVYQETKGLFPNTPIDILDYDHTKSPQERISLLNNFTAKSSAAILITTGAIFSLPLYSVYQSRLIGLSAFLNFDLLTNFPDFCANERALQALRTILYLSKDTVIQTYQPDNDLWEMLQKNRYGQFYKKELALRKALEYPPFWQMAKLTYRHKDEAKALKEARHLLKQLKEVKAALQNKENIKVLGPLPAFRYKVKGYYRQIILIKIKRNNLKLRNQLLRLVPSNWDIDIDPVEI